MSGSRRSITIVSAILLLILTGALAFQIQPKDKARVVRRGNQVSVVSSRIGWAPRFLGTSCLVPLQDGKLWFKQPVTLETQSGDAYESEISFLYDSPKSLPSGWPKGNWSASLQQFVRQRAAEWSRGEASDAIAKDPREAGREASEWIRRDFASAGLAIESAAFRIRLPESFSATLPVPQVRQLARPERPVIFIGLDGADWELLDDYMKNGSMPNLAAMVREGHGGTLLTQHPPLSPILWTTMMTGASPLEHRILDFTRYRPGGGTKEPITSDERKVPAVWNMETYGGKKVASFALWATYPAEPVHGLLVSDRLFTFLFEEKSPPPGIIYPRSRESWGREKLKEVEKSVTIDTLRQYFPWLSEPEYQDAVKEENPYGEPVSALRRILIETGVYHRLGVDYISAQNPDLAIVYFQGTDSIGHVFAPFAPPRQPNISETDYDRYSRVPELYFRYIDSLLGEYRRIAEKRNGIVMIASDHGFMWHEGRPTQLSSFAAATAAKWHRKEGIYLVWGTGIGAAPGHPSTGSITQVCATLLALSGMPAGEKMLGPSLPGTPAPNKSVVDYRPFYHPAAPVVTAAAATTNDEEIAKLRALGYIGSNEPTTAPAAAAGSARTAGSYNNEGLIRKNMNDLPGAEAAYEKAIAIDPNLASALWNLSDLLWSERKEERADQLLVRALANDLPEGPKFVIGRAIGYQRAGHADKSLMLLNAAVDAKGDDAELRMFRGRYRVEQRDCAGALEDFRTATEIMPNNAVAYASAGVAALCLGQQQIAVDNFRKSLEIEPNQPQLIQYLRQLQ